jgi:hypothetical protein
MATYAPRINKLETDVAILRNDHDALEKQVCDPKRGLGAAHERLDSNDQLAVSVKIAISIGRWLLLTFGVLIVALVFNIITHAVEIVRP